MQLHKTTGITESFAQNRCSRLNQNFVVHVITRQNEKNTTAVSSSTYNSKYRRIAADDERKPSEARDSMCKSNRQLHVKILCTVLQY